MRTFQPRLGDTECAIYAPEAGDFPAAAFYEDFPAGGLYGLDFETSALTDKRHWDPAFHGRLVQFATEGYAWVLDLADPDQHLAAVTLLRDPLTWFASHSSMDVLTAQMALGVDISTRNVDTLVLAKMADPQAKKGGADLKTVAARLGMPQLKLAEEDLERTFKIIWGAHVDAERARRKLAGEPVKGLTKTFGPEARAYAWNNIPVGNSHYLTYAGMDAVAARRLVPLLVAECQAPAQLIATEMWLAGAACRLQLRGHRVDVELARRLHREASDATGVANARVLALTGLNASQTVKMIGWMSEHGADLDLLPRTKTGGPSMAGDALAGLLDHPNLDEEGQAAVLALLEVQRWADQLTKVGGVLDALDDNGRTHSSLNTLEATTARMSSSGPNMQNFSGKLRQVYLPEEGHVLISGDFSTVELRVAAGLANEQIMIDAIVRGDDLHQLTADRLGLEGKNARQIGKRTNFLSAYGGGGKALHEQTGVPLDEAYQVVRAFWDAYPSLDAHNYEMKQQTSAVYTISRRRLPVGTYEGQPKTYANMNTEIQSSARDLLVDAWWRLAVERGKDHWVWLPIHDELVIQVPAEEAPEAMALLRECMTMVFMGVPIDAEVEILVDPQGVSRWAKGE